MTAILFGLAYAFAFVFGVVIGVLIGIDWPRPTSPGGKV